MFVTGGADGIGIAALGGVSVLVNNAANDDRHDWREVTPEYFDDRINTRRSRDAGCITRTMARTLGPHGVRVNTVLPG